MPGIYAESTVDSSDFETDVGKYISIPGTRIEFTIRGLIRNAVLRISQGEIICFERPCGWVLPLGASTSEALSGVSSAPPGPREQDAAVRLEQPRTWPFLLLRRSSGEHQGLA